MLGSQKPSSVKAQQPQKRCNQERQYLSGETFVGNNFRRYYFLVGNNFHHLTKSSWHFTDEKLLSTKNFTISRILRVAY